MKQTKVLFLIPYPLGEAPSQRFRFEQYFDALKANGVQYAVQSFLSDKHWKIFFKPGNTLLKAWILMAGFLRRTLMLLRATRYDFVFIHREATPVGPPVFEWILATILRRKIVYDFDDAIWLTDRPDESWLMRTAKWRSKVAAICRWSYKVSCGNDYLRDYAARFNPRAIVNPTTLDTEHWHNPALFGAPRAEQNTVVIGWTGSHSTLKYLNEIEPALARTVSKYPHVKLMVIADREPSLAVPVTFVPWKHDTEIEDLLRVDIGIMPLPDDEWAKGKCGFKALQYMAMEVPAVASPVGVNPVIIDHGVDGFLCASNDEWEIVLSRLIEDATLRHTLGKKGREKIIARYSVVSNTSTVVSLFA